MLTPLTGLRTRNTSLTLRLNFSESLSALRVGFVGGILGHRHPDTFVVIDVTEDGQYSLELLAVDVAGNVQRQSTKFSWTTDTSRFFYSQFPMKLA